MVRKNRISLLLILGMTLIGMTGSRIANADFSDDFSDGNDDGWQHIVGTEFYVETGQYSIGSTNDDIITMSIVGSLSYVDATMTVDATIQSADTDLFVIFDYVDTDNWIGWGFQNYDLNYNHMVGGVLQVQWVSAAPESGTHSYQVDKQGSSIDLYYDGALLLSDSFSGNLGSIGLMTIDGHAHFDDFSVTGTPAPEPSSIILVGAGLMGMTVFRKRHTKA